MNDMTSIEWADSTFSPGSGCTKISPGCDHCYAESMMDTRLHRVRWGAGQPCIRTSAANWRKPLQWNAQADAFFAEHGRRRRVFCASLADVFDNAVDPAWRADLFDLIDNTPDLDWLLLTKRIGNVVPIVGEVAVRLPDNVWLGATVVSQTEADRDIPKLLATPARVKFVSMEPLLGAVDISDWLTPGYPHCTTGFHQGDAMPHDYCGTCAGHRSDAIHQAGMHDFIDWVIVGGESGPGARPMHVDWVRSLRDQCANAGVPFLFKQWGEWFSTSIDKEQTAQTAVMPDGKRATLNDQGREARLRWHEWTADTRHSSLQPAITIALGKKTAGRLLDGQLHDGFPLLDIA